MTVGAGKSKLNAMPSTPASAPDLRGRGLRRLRRLTLAVAGGSAAALGVAAYAAAITIPGSTGATTPVAAVTATPTPPPTATTPPATPTATAAPTPAPTATTKPVAVTGGSKG